MSYNPFGDSPAISPPSTNPFDVSTPTTSTSNSASTNPFGTPTVQPTPPSPQKGSGPTTTAASTNPFALPVSSTTNPFDDPPPTTTKKTIPNSAGTSSTPSLNSPQSPRRDGGMRSPSPNPPNNTNNSANTNASSSTANSHANHARRADTSRSVSPSSAGMSGSTKSSHSSNRSPSPVMNNSSSGFSSLSASLPPSRSQSQPRSQSPSSELSTPSTLPRSSTSTSLHISISGGTPAPKVYGASFAIPNVSLVASGGTPSSAKKRRNLPPEDDMDSPQFDCDKYIKTLIRREGIEGLRANDNRVRQEMKTLDLTMKELVHKNYTKFIGAADTITKIHNNIDHIEEQAMALSERLKKVEALTQHLATNLESKQAEIGQLADVHQTLDRLQYLALLPQKLEESLKTGIYNDGIAYYQETRPLLAKYSHIRSFHQIISKSEILFQRIKKDLLSKFDNPKVSSIETKNAAALLFRMDESHASLRNRFLETRMAFLLESLEKWRRIVVQPMTPDESVSDMYSRYLQNLDASFLPQVIPFVDLYFFLFVIKSAEAGVDPEAEEALLDEKIGTLLDQYVATVTPKLLESNLSSAMVKCLSVMETDFLNLTKNNAGSIGSEIGNRFPYVQNRVFVSLISHYFNTFSNSFIEKLLEINKSLLAIEKDNTPVDKNNNLYQTSVISAQQTFSKLFDELIASVGSMLSESSYTGLVEIISFAFQQTLQVDLSRKINTQVFEQFSRDSFSMSFLLVLNRIWIQIDQKVIDEIDKKLSQLSQRSGGEKITFDFKKARESVCEQAQKCLISYVRLQGEKVGILLRKTFETNWATKQEPRDVDIGIDMFTEELKSFKLQLDVTYVSSRKGDLAKVQSVRGPMKGSSSQLFSQTLSNFHKVEPTKTSVMNAITKHALKIYLEHVRLTTFTVNGYQQIQVNLQYIKLRLAEWLTDRETVIGHMMTEIMNSAKERTLEPVLMDSSIVERLCQERISRTNQNTANNT